MFMSRHIMPRVDNFLGWAPSAEENSPTAILTNSCPLKSHLVSLGEGEEGEEGEASHYSTTWFFPKGG
jgi:hypothetical protein